MYGVCFLLIQSSAYIHSELIYAFQCNLPLNNRIVRSYLMYGFDPVILIHIAGAGNRVHEIPLFWGLAG